jgi:hypothetical protein
VDAGAAIAAAPTKRENTQIARALRADIYFLLCMVESGELTDIRAWQAKEVSVKVTFILDGPASAGLHYAHRAGW